MREIKFRGTCAISGEVVYGDLIHGVGAKEGNIYILPRKINLAYIKHCDPLDGVRVIPESVGQFTGMKDKDGNEIYKGDTVEYHNEKGEVVESSYELYSDCVIPCYCVANMALTADENMICKYVKVVQPEIEKVIS